MWESKVPEVSEFKRIEGNHMVIQQLVQVSNPGISRARRVVNGMVSRKNMPANTEIIRSVNVSADRVGTGSFHIRPADGKAGFIMARFCINMHRVPFRGCKAVAEIPGPMVGVPR